MNSERRRQIAALADAARARPPRDRQAFLEQACRGDSRMRREVEALVAQEQSADATRTVVAESVRPPLRPGEQIGPYEIEAALGEGGMGTVFRARDTRLGRAVAIKLIRADFAQRDDFRHRFEREARAISALNHPHICSLYDIGEQDGLSYLVMEFVEGETLGQVLKKGPLPLDLALRYGAEIASALAAAHAHGIVHRDLKPANIMITAAGVKVLDFGLAKRAETAAADEATVTITSRETQAGQILGTVAYMSPEQAEGRAVTASSDIFSLGVVLYEVLCGQRPFRGDSTLGLLAAILRESPEPLRKLRGEIPENVERTVFRCLEKKRENRFGSAEEVQGTLAAYRTEKPGASVFRRRAYGLAGVVALSAVGVLGAQAYLRYSHIRSAREQALPEVVRLLDESRPLAALGALRNAEQYIPSDPQLLHLKTGLPGGKLAIETTPPGAEVSVRDYVDADASNEAPWLDLGPAPLTTDRVPDGYFRVRAVRAGYEPVERAVAVGVYGATTLRIQLHTTAETPPGMVWVAGIGRGSRGTGQAAPAVINDDAPEFWIDRHEVTNREFKTFVDAGGYQKHEYWKHPFIEDAKTLSWEQATASFRDATGKPGPATWELGNYREGTADLPVGGVNWYEAAAYAAFAGKSLPTVYHWYRAAGIGAYSDVLRFSNFAGKGLEHVEQSGGLGPFGTYDMAGNVKEWAQNPTGDRRYILGGAWNEPNYQFSQPDARHPFDREATFGFRCAKYILAIPPALEGPVPFMDRDRRNDKPVDDQAYKIFLSLHTYDKTELRPAVESTDDASPYWRIENVTFQAAYGGERMLAHLYLPKNGTPPYQVVIYMGGTTTLTLRSIDEQFASLNYGSVVRSGRAVVVPAYKGTFERGPGAYYHQIGQPNLWREMNLEWSKDLGRTIDYLATRPDFDVGQLAFLGLSMGAAMSPRLLAVEPRFKAAILISGGSFERVPPEVDPWNFAPHVKIPLLMLNGRDDYLFPLETSQRPLFRAFGTAEKDKKQVLFDGGHVSLTTRLDLVKESLDWLDHYVGPVKTQP